MITMIKVVSKKKMPLLLFVSSLVRSRKRELCVGPDVAEDRHFLFIGEEKSLAKSFFFSGGFQSLFFLRVLFRVSKVLFSSLSIGKEMCYQQHFSTETGHA